MLPIASRAEGVKFHTQLGALTLSVCIDIGGHDCRGTGGQTVEVLILRPNRSPGSVDALFRCNHRDLPAQLFKLRKAYNKVMVHVQVEVDEDTIDKIEDEWFNIDEAYRAWSTGGPPIPEEYQV